MYAYNSEISTCFYVHLYEFIIGFRIGFSLIILVQFAYCDEQSKDQIFVAKKGKKTRSERWE